MPVVGTKPDTTAMFRNVCKARWVITPTVSSAPKRSRAWSAIQKPRRISMEKISMITHAPISPSSSQITEKIKSLYCSGRYRNFCRPRPSPTPKRPPEPMVIRLCASW